MWYFGKKKYPWKRSRASIKWKVTCPLCVCLVGDEGQRARKSKQEALPTLEAAFTKLQQLSYFDQHQVTSQVAAEADLLRSRGISLELFHALCVFSLRCFINAFLKCAWKCLKTVKCFSFKCWFTFLRINFYPRNIFTLWSQPALHKIFSNAILTLLYFVTCIADW